MNPQNLSVREMQESDIQLIADYWLTSSKEHLLGMGADPEKIPSREGLTSMLQAQLQLPYSQKQAYCIIWEADGQAIGHCNINNITFAEEAYMHLHTWHADKRRKGAGLELVKMTLPFFFRHFQLKNLYCEPYALNPAPNKTLEKAGFTFVKKYVTTPGSITFEQEVNRWVMRK